MCTCFQSTTADPSRSQSHSSILFSPPDPPQFPLAALNFTAQLGRGNIHDAMDFASFTRSERTWTTYEDPAFLPTDQSKADIVPGGSDSAHENTDYKPDSAAYEMA